MCYPSSLFPYYIQNEVTSELFSLSGGYKNPDLYYYDPSSTCMQGIPSSFVKPKKFDLLQLSPVLAFFISLQAEVHVEQVFNL